MSTKSDVPRDAAYKDAHKPLQERLDDLMKRMTFEEKLAQLDACTGGQLPSKGKGEFDYDKARERFAHGVGMIGWPQNMSAQAGRFTPLPFADMVAGEPSPIGARGTAEITNAIQRYFVEQTRLGIPAMFHVEALHGMGIMDATSLPQAIAMASTWNPALIEQLFSAAAREGRAAGIHHALSPTLDIGRDPRWGRIEETYGEDPYLAARIAVAAIRGFQGSGPAIDNEHIIATLKHFCGYSQSDGGRNLAPVNVTERTLREIFFPPFEAAIREAGALCVMPAYNEIDGVPCHANRFLLMDVLRGDWGFEGVVVSDYASVAHLHSLRRVTRDERESASMAFNAGVDVELPNTQVFAQLAALVENGEVALTAIDAAVARVLRLKFLLGLFEQPYADVEKAERACNCREHIELTRAAARESMVLLKNTNGVLPLRREALKTLAVIGPNAAEGHIGGYGGWPRYVVDPLTGIRSKAGDDVDVLYAEGCRILRREQSNSKVLEDPDANAKRIEEAVAVARKADAVVLVLGENERLCGEGVDSATLALEGNQHELVAAIAELGKPTVALLINGRPLAVGDVAARVDALMECWYLGQEGGNAIADVLFGECSPSGKLPVSIPRHVGTLPVYYNQKARAMSDYVLTETTPLYPFGYGMSYTQFDYAHLRLSTPELDPTGGGSVEVSIDVTNAGAVAGDEVTQLYVHHRFCPVTRPEIELKGFRRLSLAPGETKTVTFSVGFDELCFYDREMRKTVTSGVVDILVGPSSVEHQSVALRVRAP